MPPIPATVNKRITPELWVYMGVKYEFEHVPQVICWKCLKTKVKLLLPEVVKLLLPEVIKH
jgi:hypothetical protein